MANSIVDIETGSSILDIVVDDDILKYGIEEMLNLETRRMINIIVEKNKKNIIASVYNGEYIVGMHYCIAITFQHVEEHLHRSFQVKNINSNNLIKRIKENEDFVQYIDTSDEFKEFISSYTPPQSIYEMILEIADFLSEDEYCVFLDIVRFWAKNFMCDTYGINLFIKQHLHNAINRVSV